MFDFQAEKYDQYKLEYDQFVRSKKTQNYSSSSKRSGYISDIADLLEYCAMQKSRQIFLVVPSIFNSPEILFLNDNHNFVQNLQKSGDVYLVNWLENNRQLLIEDYVNELKEIISFLQVVTDKQINLIGHCIGGNICIAIAAQMPKQTKINSLTLLTCPWDYSHFRKWLCMHDSLGLDKVISDCEFVPKIYIQIMFFLMFPSQFQDKINKYFDLESSEAKELFMRVEEWLQSGNAISKSMYKQIIQDFCRKNILLNNEWYVDGTPIDLKNINVPVCIIHAREDRLVPLCAMNPLQKQIKDSTLIEVEGGHIGYLINGDLCFREKYNDWLVKSVLQIK